MIACGATMSTDLPIYIIFSSFKLATVLKACHCLRLTTGCNPWYDFN